MSELAQMVCVVLVIDLIVSLIVGFSVLLNAEFFWDKTRDCKRQSLQAMLLANSYIFGFCAFFFLVVRIWAWAPLNIATTVIPFKLTWRFAIGLAIFAALGWALPVKRAMAKLQRTDCAKV